MNIVKTHAAEQGSLSDLRLIGQTLPRTGFMMSFCEDDMSPFLLKAVNIVLSRK
jgi:hypothetical protein